MREELSQIKRFNIRVYGLWINNGKVLLSNENRFGKEMLKFPGGGLEKGEGLEAALQREFLEEIGIKIEVLEHFYVNPFFQQSAFRKEDQLLTFYYFVQPEITDSTVRTILDSKTYSTNDEEVFHWCTIEQLNSITMTFPIDQIVAQKLAAGLRAKND
jgi:ADP-ribose pyrophosphatase YjhB (NUDIX family)